VDSWQELITIASVGVLCYVQGQRKQRQKDDQYEEREEIVENAWHEFAEQGGVEGDEQAYECRCGNVVFIDRNAPPPTCTGLSNKEHKHRVMRTIDDPVEHLIEYDMKRLRRQGRV